MSTTDATDDRYDKVRVYLAGLPHDQYTVELPLSQIEELIGGPLPTEVSDSNGLPDKLPTSLSRSWLEAGFGLSVVQYQSNEVILCLVRGLHRWPDVSINSEEFGKLPADARLYQLAIGYLEAGKLICRHLGDNPGELTWPRILPALFCYRHAVELFVKSCILHRQPVAKCDHNIGGLLEQYLELYPQDEFRFHYKPELPDLEKLLGDLVTDKKKPNEEELKESSLRPSLRFERKPDQVLRYFADKQGRSPGGRYGSSPADCLSLLEQLERDMARIWGAISEMDGRAEAPAAS